MRTTSHPMKVRERAIDEMEEIGCRQHGDYLIWVLDWIYLENMLLIRLHPVSAWFG